jgi:hypothetical protein
LFYGCTAFAFLYKQRQARGQPLSTISVRSCIASFEASAPLTSSHVAAAVKSRCYQPAMSKVLRGEWIGMDERRGGCISAEVEGSFRGKSRLDLPKIAAMDMAHLTCYLLLRIRGQLNAAIRDFSPNADGVLCATTMGSACVVENVWLAASLPALLLAMNHPLVQR